MGGPKKPSWQTQETRHYCAVCNAWMGNDRQSILLHENGKKHKEAMEKSLQDRRDHKAKQDRQAKQVQSSLQAMEQAALQAMGGQDSQYYDTSSYQIPQQAPPGAAGAGRYAYGAAVAGAAFMAPPPPPPPPQIKEEASSKNKDLKEWNKRRKQRQEEQNKDDISDDDEDGAAAASGARAVGANRRTIAPDEGYYTIDNDSDTKKDDGEDDSKKKTTTYLEGVVFAELLEEDMPIQIWTGSNLATPQERKLLHNQSLWVNGLVVSMRRSKKKGFVAEGEWDEDRMVVNVAYLKNPTDTDETLEQGVRLHRIRIVLGADDSIPDTVEEARILAMGGEEIQVPQGSSSSAAVAQADNNNSGLTQAEIEEATGLTGWSTVTIRRTTAHQEAREERERERQKQRQARRAAEDSVKEAQMRKMDESKVANADDSALGAYDVWSQTQGRGGYKGIDIHTEANVSVQDTAKRLAAEGETVAFKSKGSNFKSKMAGKKRNRRTTSADDD